MEDNCVRFRHLMLLFYRKGKNAIQTVRKIREVYGDDAVGEHRVRQWFAKFRQGDFTVEDRQRSGRLSSVGNDQIKMLIETNRHITTRELGERLGVPKSTIHKHLMGLGFLNAVMFGYLTN
ncbi:hypothetical protein TELCIR_17901 [Teladorsagia circumcincta]|uniref:Mos1 transposase HTH domain-containing protein n=1 Tax=Teladorsagia circumcincta TaxID=45464 RepID=A0A2G9TRI3_TELCI|nr:hypothetical protein TELCIR_17901 [Teladorsagia circumcincta]